MDKLLPFEYNPHYIFHLYNNNNNEYIVIIIYHKTNELPLLNVLCLRHAVKQYLFTTKLGKVFNYS